MKQKFIFTLAAIVLFLVQYGLLGGIGGRAAAALLLADAIVWTTFFFKREDGYFLAIISGTLSEFISPYRFGYALLAFIFIFLTVDFLSRKVFTNRMLHSYLFISLLGLGAYVIVLLGGSLLDNLATGKLVIAPVEASFREVGEMLLCNLAILAAAFFLTNALTKKMHAAFIMN